MIAHPQLAMHAVNTPDLPKPDSIHADELGTWLGEEISQARYAIKKTVCCHPLILNDDFHVCHPDF